VEETAFIIYDSKPGTKLTIVLGEVVNDAGVRRIDEEDMEQKLERILAGKAMLPAPRFIAHADVSDADGEELFKRSLNFILTKEPFRKDLKLPLPALLLSDDPNAAPPLPDVQLISEEFVKEKLRVGESIKYLKYTGFGSHGNEVTVSILYYTPRVLRNGAGYIGRGLVINFTYVKQQSRYKLKRVDTIGLDY
jgi:hypothetical protein